jgi:hypothetical protein
MLASIPSRPEGLWQAAEKAGSWQINETNEINESVEARVAPLKPVFWYRVRVDIARRYLQKPVPTAR